MANHTSKLAKIIAVAGIIELTCSSVQTLLSFFLTPVNIGGARPREAEFFAELANHFAFLGPAVSNAIRGQGLFTDAASFMAAYHLPAIVSTIVVIVLLHLLNTRPPVDNDGTPRQLLRWAVGFAVVSAFALPVFAQDFWLSAAWGRLIVAGQNPYYVSLTNDTVKGIPLDDLSLRMTYGPSWALISGAVMWLARGSALLGGALFKLVLLAAWVLALRLVSSISQVYGNLRQSQALVLFGWMPLGFTQAVAEGHNDILMVVLVLLWLHSLQSKAPLRGTIALALAVTMKYVVVSLFLLDLVAAIRQSAAIRGYVKNTAAGLLVIAVCLAAFYRSPAFFDPLRSMTHWHFLEPGDAIAMIGALLHWNVSLPVKAIRLLFPAIAAYTVLSLWTAFSLERLFRAALALMTAILLSVVGHVFPWYFIWVLPLAALCPGWPLAIWLGGIVTLANWAYTKAYLFPEDSHLNRWLLPAFVMYALPAVFLVWTSIRGATSPSGQAKVVR